MKIQQNTKKRSIIIDSDVWKKIKIWAVQEDITMGDAVRIMVDSFINEDLIIKEVNHV